MQRKLPIFVAFSVRKENILISVLLSYNMRRFLQLVV